MRSFTENKVVGWIFDEKTHPYGNENPANMKKVESKPVEVIKPKIVEVKKEELKTVLKKKK
jgi:hypothetical protein